MAAICVCCSSSESDPTVPDETTQIDGTIYSKHFVQLYVDVDALTAVSAEDYVTVHCNGTKYGAAAKADAFGDNGYNARIAVNSTRAICNRITAIDLTSDSDFDERHKAGSSLADLVFLVGESPYAYIRSNYTQVYDWKVLPEFIRDRGIELSRRPGYAPVCKRLSEIAVGDLSLLHPTFRLVFESQPPAARSHRMTLTMVDDKGKSVSAVFDWPAV